MAKTKQQKEEIIKALKDKIKRAKSIIFTSFNGLDVKENNALRQELKKGRGEYYVAKKTLLELAFFGHKKMTDFKIKEFKGQIATVFSYDDEVMGVKILDKFKEKNEGKIEFIGGILENKVINAQAVSDLAKIPNRHELWIKLVMTINAPISRLVNCLAGNYKNLIYALKAIEESKNK